MKLKEKVAIITGAGQGIGREYARRLAKEGAHVIVADLNMDKAIQVANEIKELNLKASAIQVDVSNEQSTIDMAKQIEKQYGKIDILINNAAIFSTIKMKKMEEISGGEWDSVLDVNLKGIFLCCKAVVPIMKKQNYGRIINISSAAVYLGRPDYIHYVASKAGVLGFTGALSREIGEFNITVNSITPGPTYTEIPRETVSEIQKKELLKIQSIKKLQEPSDLSGVVVFLCTDDASFITGQTFNVDGGMTVRL
ncbi:3-oxoacyl-ACP reductase family protein [Niallia oryzisoli]|uniref:3-oxoacyl-ACP reductase family protein n=1 Tax=Niallia oryzisoli TaxID=1737571 RepID=A0ABZ2CAA1_9BACI